MAYIRKVANKIGSPHKSADVVVDESVLLAKTLQGSTIMSFESIEDLRQISLETTFFKVRHQVPLSSSCHNGIEMQSHESRRRSSCACNVGSSTVSGTIAPRNISDDGDRSSRTVLSSIPA